MLNVNRNTGRMYILCISSKINLWQISVCAESVLEATSTSCHHVRFKKLLEGLSYLKRLIPKLKAYIKVKIKQTYIQCSNLVLGRPLFSVLKDLFWPYHFLSHYPSKLHKNSIYKSEITWMMAKSVNIFNILHGLWLIVNF